MQNKYSKYPLSSCNCYGECNCALNINCGIPTNMSVANCALNQPGLKNRPLFKTQVEPRNTRCRSNISSFPRKNKYADEAGKGYTYLNTLSSQDFNPDFNKVNCPESSRCKTVYFAQDARLFDPRRNSLIKLDRPPFSSNFFTTNNPANYFSIYSKKFNEYGRPYRSYADINLGDILYYTDHETEDAYNAPNFTIPAQVDGVLFRDPMGALKPTYVRSIVSKPDECYNKLSWIRDSAMHREDIMAGQMSQRNQQRRAPRWNRLNKCV
jgi:hypothetical protein